MLLSRVTNASFLFTLSSILALTETAELPKRFSSRPAAHPLSHYVRHFTTRTSFAKKQGLISAQKNPFALVLNANPPQLAGFSTADSALI